MPFRLFRSTSPSNRCAYVGQVTLPDGRSFLIEADAVVSPEGLKSFEGRLYPANAAKMFRDARLEGTVPPAHLDLVAQAESDPLPFNDPLPEFKP